MELDRSVLARIDRRLLSGLGGDETWRTVRVPATAAMWSTWKRYCDAAGLSMGRAIAMLIGHELAGVVDNTDREDAPIFATRAYEELAKWEAEIARREQTLEAGQDRLRAWDEHLRRRAGDLDARERQAELAATLSARSEQPQGKVGRNEPCPCGSGRKYKRCHGSPTRQRQDGPGPGSLKG